MENASKALMIAGGVLIALIIITMFILMFSRLSNIQEEQEEQTKIEQIVAFNEQFEAYNKKVLYGTDVITVMNKAIQNNINMNATNIENRRYINIKLKLKDTIQTTIIRENMGTGKTEDFNNFNFIEEHFGYDLSTTKLEKNKTYSLGTYEGNELKMDERIKDLFLSKPNDYKCQEGSYRYHIQSALTNFVKTVYKCTNVKYNDDGTIMEMTFEQK